MPSQSPLVAHATVHRPLAAPTSGSLARTQVRPVPQSASAVHCWPRALVLAAALPPVPPRPTAPPLPEAPPLLLPPVINPPPTPPPVTSSLPQLTVAASVPNEMTTRASQVRALTTKPPRAPRSGTGFTLRRFPRLQEQCKTKVDRCVVRCGVIRVSYCAGFRLSGRAGAHLSAQRRIFE